MKSIVISLLLSFITQERVTQEGLDVHTTTRQTLSQSYLLSTFLRDYLSFLKFIYSLLRGIYSPSLFLLRCYLILKSKTFGFFLGSSYVYMSVHVNRFLFAVLLFSCLLLQGSQLETRLVEEKWFFYLLH